MTKNNRAHAQKSARVVPRVFFAFGGANLAGMLGIFLAASVLVTARVVGKFVVRELLEPVG